MRIPRTALVCSPLFLCLTMGATDCKYFSTTTVPTADTTPPVTWDAVFANGDWTNLTLTGNRFTYHLAPGATVIALSSGMDSGGVSKVTMGPSEGWTCCSGDICSQTDSLSIPIVATQPGGAGDTVSDGVWANRVVSLPANLCQSGWTLVSYRFTWTTTAEDFYGNKTSGKLQVIQYP